MKATHIAVLCRAWTAESLGVTLPMSLAYAQGHRHAFATAAPLNIPDVGAVANNQKAVWGAWSNQAIWSTGHVPLARGAVAIVAGTEASDAITSNPTWPRLALKPRAGHTTLTLAIALTGWRPGDPANSPRHTTYAVG